MNQNLEASYPISPTQLGMLFHRLNAPRAAKDLFQVACRWRHNVDISALRAAWKAAARRHPTLRLAFRWEGLAEPVQDIHREVTIPFNQEDLRHLESSQQSQRIDEYLEADRREGFLADRPPLYRIKLFHLGDADYLLVYTIHHALLDGRSLILIIKETFDYYEAYERGQEPDFKPLPRPYRDYVEWCQQYDPPQAETFWRELLRGFTTPTSLTVDKPLGADQTLEASYGEQDLCLPEPVTAALLNLAASSQVTMNTLLQAAWAVLLSRYSGEEDVVFGATRACRQSSIEGTGDMIGPMVNTLPVRARVGGECSLASLFKELRDQHLQVRDYEQVPVAKIQHWTDLPGGVALYETGVVFHNYSYQGTFRYRPGVWPDREFHVYPNLTFSANVLVYNEPQLRVKIVYDHNRLEDTAVDRILGHLKVLLEDIAAHPEKSLGELSILTEAERRQLLVDWNDTAVAYSQLGIHQLIEQQVEQTPDAVACVFDGKSLRYRELNQFANQISHCLKRRGAGPDTLIGLCLERSFDMLAALLGILKTGAAYLPVDPAYPADRKRFILEDAQASILLTQKSLAADLSGFSGESIYLTEDRSAISREATQNPAVEVTPESLAYVLYTSGSTGKPKGVQITHANVANFLASMRKKPGMTAGDTLLAVTTLSFDIAGLELYLPLVSGAKVIVASREEALDGNRLLALMNQWNVTMLQATPATWRLLLLAGWTGSSQLKALCGGEALSGELATQLIPRCKELWNMYGPTETTIWSSIFHVKAAGPGAVSIGRPIDNTTMYVLDPKSRPTPIGIPGELFIGGDGVGRGYLGRSELTAEKFAADPFVPSARLYRTGDIAKFLPDGNLQYVRRIDHQIKLRGFRIELGEIEIVLGEHPAIQECLVLVREDQPDAKRLVAYYVPAQPVTQDSVRSYLKDRLPGYMIPSALVMLDAFPLTPNGKVDRRALPVPEAEPADSTEELVAPRTPIEEVLAAIWCDILHLQRVDVRANFFDLGGNSLDYFALLNRIEKEFGSAPAVTELRNSPTIELLAKAISQPGESPVADSASAAESVLIGGSSRRSWAGIRFRLYEWLIQYGPANGGYAPAYPTASKVIWWLSGLGLLRRVLKFRILPLRQTLSLPAYPGPKDEAAVIRRSLFCNVWFLWRMLALFRSKDFDRWVTVTGFPAFRQACEDGRGVLLLSSHNHMRRVLLGLLHRHGLDDWAAVGEGDRDHQSELMGLPPIPPLEAGVPLGDKAYFPVLLYKAKKVLRRGGIVYMAPDGFHGSTKGVKVPLFGRDFTIRTGFAELALDTEASIAPVTITMDETGHLRVEFLPFLKPEGSTHQARAESLARQYSEVIRREWTENLGNANWTYLRIFMRNTAN